MKLYVGCDHAAFNEKEIVKHYLMEKGFDVSDCGTGSDERVDYPDYATKVAREVILHEGALGILLCGSGIGVSMVANRYAGIRAALCRTTEEAKLSREHNNANILCLGARITKMNELKEIIDSWLDANFEGGRHEGRIKKFTEMGEKIS